MTDGHRDRPAAPRRIAQRSRAEWHALLDAHADVHGFHLSLGSDHGALFTEDDDTLLVTFEPAGIVRDRSETGLPFGLDVAGREGWSQLCLYCEGDTFFRVDPVYRFFDTLIELAFFDRFDRVVFYGAGSCGHAAAAFSVAAPGASVLLVRPVSTLSTDRAVWDRRYATRRRTDFDSRYGAANEMLEAAERVVMIHDPMIAEDAMHSALLAGDDRLSLQVPYLGPTPERDLEAMGVLVPMLRALGRGKFTQARFFDLYRRRRGHAPYLRRVLTRLQKRQRAGLEAQWKRGIRATAGAAPDSRDRPRGE